MFGGERQSRTASRFSDFYRFPSVGHAATASLSGIDELVPSARLELATPGSEDLCSDSTELRREVILFGALAGARTQMPEGQGPQPCAYTNSATSAGVFFD